LSKHAVICTATKHFSEVAIFGGCGALLEMISPPNSPGMTKEVLCSDFCFSLPLVGQQIGGRHHQKAAWFLPFAQLRVLRVCVRRAAATCDCALDADTEMEMLC